MLTPSVINGITVAVTADRSDNDWVRVQMTVNLYGTTASTRRTMVKCGGYAPEATNMAEFTPVMFKEIMEEIAQQRAGSPATSAG